MAAAEVASGRSVPSGSGVVAAESAGSVMGSSSGCRVRSERVEASLTPEEVQAEHERYRAWFESAGEFPHIAKLMKSGVDPDDPDTREERFQFSLDCVLDGIAAKLAASGARTAP